ncbi:unnamed protein product [Prorocentrum cordatum]|uniref:Subtilisin n=1 Tax=Prorocentrum cordatum TaxID=2364126 RepID=A0ABN9VTJ9_9DINO|nr:unnamed protein product [Polarella glacialis]
MRTFNVAMVVADLQGGPVQAALVGQVHSDGSGDETNEELGDFSDHGGDGRTNEEQKTIIDKVLVEDGCEGAEEQEQDFIINQVHYHDGDVGTIEDSEAIVFGTALNADGGDSARAEQEIVIDQVLYEEQQHYTPLKSGALR